MTAKKLGLSLIILMVLMLIVSACSLGPTDAECEDAMQQLNISAGRARYDDITPLELNLILNNEHAPDTIGFLLKECVQNGWDYR